MLTLGYRFESYSDEFRGTRPETLYFQDGPDILLEIRLSGTAKQA